MRRGWFSSEDSGNRELRGETRTFFLRLASCLRKIMSLVLDDCSCISFGVTLKATASPVHVKSQGINPRKQRRQEDSA